MIPREKNVVRTGFEPVLDFRLKKMRYQFRYLTV